MTELIQEKPGQTARPPAAQIPELPSTLPVPYTSQARTQQTGTQQAPLALRPPQPTQTGQMQGGQAKPPTPVKELLGHLKVMTAGETRGVASEDLARLDNAPFVRTAAGQLGRSSAANILMGTTRELSKLPKGDNDRIGNYRMPVIGTFAANKIAEVLRQARREGTLDKLLAAYQQDKGQSLANVIGEQVRDPAKRATLQALLPSPISREQAIQDSFLENLAVGMVYSNASGKQLNTDKKPDPRRGGISQEILDAFGYKAGDNQSGLWGLQLRVFTPDPVKGKGKPVVIAFRGTEGITFDPKTPGGVDTMIGDFAPAQPGVNQFEANRDWIAVAVKAATAGGRKVTFVGHSLGGALAQEAAAAFPGVTEDVVTFQAANIPRAAVQGVEKYNKTHKDDPIEARHYRVDGDIVPTAGDAALPGDIYYFDRLSRKPGSTKPMDIAPASQQVSTLIGDVDGFKDNALKGIAFVVSKSVPYLSTDGLQKGHVVPSLSMYLRGQVQDEKVTDPKLAALMHGGIRDEQTVAQTTTKDGKTVTVPAKEEVGMAFAGQYTTANDPRINGEQARATAVPMVMDIKQAAAQVFQVNIAYNTALRHILEAAKTAKDFKAFQSEAQAILGQSKLKMTDFDIQLAEQMHLDKSPRQNAEIAWKQLADIDQESTKKVDSNINKYAKIAVGPLPAAVLSNKLDFEKMYEEHLDGMSNQPVLEQYRDPKTLNFEVPMNEGVRQQLTPINVLKDYWRLYHQGELK